MITLVSPKENETCYLLWQNFLFGPFDPVWESQGTETTFRSHLDRLAESREIYHENEVEHTSVEGYVRYDPLFGSSISTATQYFPDARKFLLSDYQKRSMYVEAYYGIACPGKQGRRLYTSPNQILVQMPFKAGKFFGFWKATTPATDPYSLTQLERWVTTGFTRGSNGSVTISYDYSAYMIPFGGEKTYVNWTQSPSLSVFESIRLKAPLYQYGIRTQTVTAYNNYGLIKSPSDMRGQVGAFVEALANEESPLEPVAFGELAMQASKKVIANQVNMIAFLRDLRKPTELIPKLKNLKQLGTLADNYLTVEYGILPTIDDLQSIVAAFHRVRPYVDRNGFRTYNAGYTTSGAGVFYQHTLEQHLKLALGGEDDEFLALIQRLESVGVLPTFENLWDLVPYSFVVDWFVDIGGFLERVDTRLRLLRLPVRYVTMSQKTTISGLITATADSPLDGNLSVVHYHRWTTDHCPVPPLSLQLSDSAPDHWLEGGALIIQRKH